MGISQEMLFESTSFHVYGPMSTTVDFVVALQFAGKGMVIDILKEKGSIPLFDCSFWSDFTNENERFFIGSLQHFTFETIHYLPLKENYEIFIRVIGILMKMITGYPYLISAIKQSDFNILSVLISDHINDTHSEKIPFYVHNLFKHIVQNVNKIHLNVRHMDRHVFGSRNHQFGYQKLKSLFFIDDQINYIKYLITNCSKLSFFIIQKVYSSNPFI